MSIKKVLVCGLLCLGMTAPTWADECKDVGSFFGGIELRHQLGTPKLELLKEYGDHKLPKGMKSVKFWVDAMYTRAPENSDLKRYIQTGWMMGYTELACVIREHIPNE